MESKPKHIILGAGGAIGKVLAEELKINKEKIKLVSRSGHAFDGAETAKADLTNPAETKNAIDENSIVYLTAGLKYDINVWQDQWPKIMRNAIDACKAKNSKLIFFDNVYSYGRVNGVMTEETPFNPCSKKGEVRAKIAEDLLAEIKNKNINAMIARAADFYGPYSEKVSMLGILVIANSSKGKRAQWMANVKTKHSFTYTRDCGKALYLLANTESAFNQTWHLPTAEPAITGEEFIKIAAGILQASPKYFLLRKWMIKMSGLFDNTIKELYEMLYQYEFDYIFDSSKFNKFFKFNPTPYNNGIDETVKFYLSQSKGK